MSGKKLTLGDLEKWILSSKDPKSLESLDKVVKAKNNALDSVVCFIQRNRAELEEGIQRPLRFRIVRCQRDMWHRLWLLGKDNHVVFDEAWATKEACEKRASQIATSFALPYEFVGNEEDKLTK